VLEIKKMEYYTGNNKNTVESQCSRTWCLGFAPLWPPTVMLLCQPVATSSDELGWQCVCSQPYPLSCPYAELSQQKLWFSLSEVERICDLWNEILLLSINTFWASEKSLYFAKHKPSGFLSFLNYCIFLLPVFQRFLETNKCFTFRMDSNVNDSLITPI
jgi:hypothetical protein